MISAKDYLAQQQQESSQEYADNASKAEAYLATQKGEAFSESSALGDVYDGDTVYDEQGGQRILGGNTSEMKSADGSSQPLSIEAQERMKELLNSGEYTKRASGEKGYYGRDLTSYVNKDGETAMTQLIREGYAAPTSYGGNDASITAEGASVAIRGERGNYNSLAELVINDQSVAIRGERGNYNVMTAYQQMMRSVAIRGERGNYNTHYKGLTILESVAIRGERGNYNKETLSLRWF